MSAKPPRDYLRSPVGVAVSPDGTPWMCPECSAGVRHDHADNCPGEACLCGVNAHGKAVITLDGGVRQMPQFARTRRTVTGTVTVQIDDDDPNEGGVREPRRPQPGPPPMTVALDPNESQRS